VKGIDFAGIPQGSPLSPLLYIFYNAGLVEQQIDGTGGALGFVDDFNAWVVGKDEEQNTLAIQESILPHAERWAKQSGATFEADKTSLIHFTRRADPDDCRPLHFGGKAILPQQSVKVLGVVLDKKLAMDEHIARVVQKGTAACLSLQVIKGTRPAQMRQLFRSCVLPITDYAASAWYGPGKPGVIRLVHALEKVQRVGARMILRAWKAVSLPILEAEAYLESTKKRLDQKVIAHTVKLISLPRSNPARRALPHALNTYRYVSPLSAVCVLAKERLKPKGSWSPIGNPPWIHPPWIDYSNRVGIKERSQTIRETATTAGANILGLYTDASVTKRPASIAVVQRIGIATQVVQQESIGWASTCGVLSAEIAAIPAALKYIQENPKPLMSELFVFSDSQQALRAIQAGNGANTGRALLSLNQYLSRIGLVDEAKGSCGNDEETIRHLILSCPRWTVERRELREAVGARSGDVPYLLGGWSSRKDVRTGRLLDGPKEKWKPDMEAIKATIRFLEKTGRLTYQPSAE
jgi:hypothetical protein